MADTVTTNYGWVKPEVGAAAGSGLWGAKLNSNFDAIDTKVKAVETALAAGGAPTGSVIDFAGTSAPAGWLLSFGQAVSRTTYAALFAVVGTTYGIGDGSTTFNLPDLRGRVVAGKDDMGGSSANRITVPFNGDTLGASGGAETHILTAADTPTHTHTQQGSFVSGGESANHTHTQTGTFNTDTEPAHSHAATVASFILGGNIGGGNSIGGGTSGQSSTTTAAAGSHNHSVTISGQTGTISAGHTHTTTISGATTSFGSGAAHNNMQPTFILNKIIKT